jgi:hypothetical protein
VGACAHGHGARGCAPQRMKPRRLIEERLVRRRPRGSAKSGPGKPFRAVPSPGPDLSDLTFEPSTGLRRQTAGSHSPGD